MPDECVVYVPMYMSAYVLWRYEFMHSQTVWCDFLCRKNGVNLNTTSVKTAILLLCGGKLNEKLKCEDTDSNLSLCVFLCG